MAPAGNSAVQVLSFDDAAQAVPGDVVVEAFGCDPPGAFIAHMAAANAAGAAVPLWINLEYLSAEPWVERSHGLPSPQLAGPGAGLTKWFFFPGFTRRTGGLIQETDLHLRRQAFDARTWWTLWPVKPEPGERTVSLFCYDSAPVEALLDLLASQPTLLLACAGTPAARVAAALGSGLRHGYLRALLLPYVPQREYDRLLWACDINFVRGEDSFVRAQLAGRPFVWNLYAQHDVAHAQKLQAFARAFQAAQTVPHWDALQLAWNGLAPWSTAALPDRHRWATHSKHWAQALWQAGAAGGDLCSRLIAFVAGRR